MGNVARQGLVGYDEGAMLRIAAVLLLLPASLLAQAQPQYDYIDLTATYGDFSYSGMNDHGVIIGSHPAGQAGFYIDSTGLHYLPEVSPGRAFLPVAINNNGDILGWAYPQGASSFRSYIYRNGTLTDLNIQGTYERGAAYDISDSGYVVGAERSGNSRAFRWFNGQIEFLPFPSGGVSAAFAVNESGDSVGVGGSPPDFTANVLRWDAQGLTYLSGPGPQGYGFGYDINDSGFAVEVLGHPLSSPTTAVHRTSAPPTQFT